MQVESAFIANYAEVRDSLAYVIGGFPEWWDVPDLPTSALLGLTLVVRLDNSEVGSSSQWTVTLADAVGRREVASFTAGRSPQDSPPGMPLRQVVSFVLPVEFRTAGLHEFTWREANGVTASASVFVRLPTR